METARHKNYKDQLFNHLHNQINGCLECGPLSTANRRDHVPSIDRPRAPMQEIVWLCSAGHHHTLDIFTKAAWCEQERQFTAPSGLKCKPDITIYDAHRNPCVFIEIRYKNARNNTRKVAQEIGALWLQLQAPPPGSFQKELSSSRPWWELTNMPENAKREMDALTRLGDKLFGAPRTALGQASTAFSTMTEAWLLRPCNTRNPSSGTANFRRWAGTSGSANAR